MRRLLIRPGGIGDCVTCFPVMERLRTEYTEVWVPRPLVSLVEFADCVRAIADTGLDSAAIAEPELPSSLAQIFASFDDIVSWYGAKRPLFLQAVLAANRRARFFPALPPADGTLHVTDFHAASLGIPSGLVPRINAGIAPPRPTAVFHPFSGGRHKNWPLERFRELERRCLPFTVEWTAGPQEPLADAQRFDDLLALARWIKGAQIYVGNDSGITHLAAAAGVPVIAIFGAANAQIWAPRGPHVTVIAAPSLEALTVDQVCSALRRQHLE